MKRNLMKKQGIVVRLLVLTAIIAMLAGCAGGGTGGGADTTTEAATTAAATTAAATAATTSSAGDGTAQSYTWQELWEKPAEGTYDPVGLSPVAEPITLKVVHSYDSNSASIVSGGVTPENGMWNDIIRAQLNVEFEFMWVVPSEQYDQRMQLSISAGEIPDVIRMNQKQFRTFIDTNSLRDLTEAYETYAIPELKIMDESVDYAPIRQATVDGKLLAIPRYEDNHASVNVVWYRKDWADQLGIEKPETISDLEQMAIAFGNQSDAPDKDGLLAQSKILDEAGGLGAYFQCYGAYPNKWIMKDGQIVPGLIQDEMLTGLKAAKSLYDNNAIPQDFAALSPDQGAEKITNATIGMEFGKWWAPDWPLRTSIQYDKAADWTLIPLPGEVAGSPAISTIEENMVHFYTGLNKDAPEGAEEAMIKVMNFYYVDRFPASPSTWPQSPLPMTEEERQINIERGEAATKLGMHWNWCPIMTWYATENTDRSRIVNEAAKSRDISGLRNSADKGWYDATVDWLDNGRDDPEYDGNWTTYASRTMDDSGVLLTVRMKEEGSVIPNVFYGGATVTEEQISSTLGDLTQEYITNFILGEVGEDSWQGFVDEWLSLGGQDWWDEVVEGYNAIH